MYLNSNNMSQKQNIQQSKMQNTIEEKGGGIGSFFIFFGSFVALIIILGLVMQLITK